MFRRRLIIPFLLAGIVIAFPAAAHEGHAANEKHSSQDKPQSGAGTVMTTRSAASMPLPPTADDVFHFVIYGDRTGGVPEGLKVLEQAVKDTNLLDPDLVMTVGDLIQGYNEDPEWLAQMKEYKQVMKGLKMSWYPVAGNHDIYWRGEGPAPKGHHEDNYEKHFGPLWYSFQHKNAGFIVLYSDEGDPVTNRKAFNVGELQQMSEAQLAFLDKALRELEGADHVFVFLHHPRWISGRYEGSNWDVVHEKLRDAGNVSAVFAGHIHRMHYDGVQDGIEYFALATTGGHLQADIPGAGLLHHLNLVTVRPSGTSVSTIPIGSVVDPKDFTPAFLREIDLARSVVPVQTSPDLILDADGSAAGEVRFTINNVCPRAIAATFMLDGGSDATNWVSTLDHQHRTIQPGETAEVAFTVVRTPGRSDEVKLPALRIEAEYLGESARIRLPAVSEPITLRPGQVPADYFTDAPNHALRVTGEQAAVRIDADEIKLPIGPMTLEAWVRPDELAGYNGIIAKTQNSEFAFFSDEGVPQFDIHLGGSYVTAAAESKLEPSRWTHLAGVYDGENVMLFVNGKQVASVQGRGERTTNELPLFAGADPDGSGSPTRAFRGSIDEVRLSKAAIYRDDFSPSRQLLPGDETVLMLHFDRKLGPFILDHSDSAATGVLGSKSRLVPVSD